MSSSVDPSALNLSFKRSLLEGTVHEEDEENLHSSSGYQQQHEQNDTSWLSDAASLNAATPSPTYSDPIRHPRSFGYSSYLLNPLSSPSTGVSDSASTSIRCCCFNCHCTARCKTICTLLCGFGLILLVLILFLILLNKNLHHPQNEQLNRNVFQMQLLGQSVLRFDVSLDEDTSAEDSTTRAWISNWSSILDADFVLSDLETSLLGPFGGIDWRANNFSHIAPPSTLDLMTKMGINMWACANNHQWDLGIEGLYNAFAALASRNLTCAGIGSNDAVATAGTVLIDRATKGIQIAVLGMASGSVNDSVIAGPNNPGVNALRVDYPGKVQVEDLNRNINAIDAAVAAQGNDLVVVYHHNHYQFNATADPHIVESWRIQLAHQFIDRGASFYVSHGQPYVQGIEIYNGAPIFYGLGNFIFQSRAGPEHWGTAAYEGVLTDMEWGCVSCSGNSMPVASMPPKNTAKPVLMNARNSPNRFHSLSSAASHSPASRSLQHQQQRGNVRMASPASNQQSSSSKLSSFSRHASRSLLQPSRRSLLKARGHRRLLPSLGEEAEEASEAYQEEMHEEQAEALHDEAEYEHEPHTDEEQRERATAEKQQQEGYKESFHAAHAETHTHENPYKPPFRSVLDEPLPTLPSMPTLPSPASPSATSACSCGYRLTSLKLRPVSILRPDIQTIPQAMQFNHSWGLPSLDMDMQEATQLLKQIQQLSATFGTQMEIIEDIGSLDGPQRVVMRSTVFARVKLD